ncbi:hypothetical protein B0H12DRAFT_330639 [Mycena haematopus]|nr:hypothetical protein B0H12DRAFT_330639 [Mycena haematopus]
MADPLLAARVENVFVRGTKTVLVNTSGAGKTRLTFEGLCHNWGFYFTILSLGAADLGSRDMRDVIEDLSHSRSGFVKEFLPASADAAEKRKHNHSLAEEALCRALLGRLLVFRMFLDIANEGGGIKPDHKMKWLIFQLMPRLPTYGDVFQLLLDRLSDYDPRPGGDIPAALDGIHAHLGPDKSHLFFVLDEAQVAAHKFPDGFHPVPGTLPLLRKILDTWDTHVPRESFSCVVAGTDIPTRIFESDAGYAGQVRWTSDTGAFDDRVRHGRYLRRFLPPSLLDTRLGEEFLRRAWAWTRGRHRYTASLVMILLESNFREPHLMLDLYIAAATKFRPTDGTRWTEPERRGMHLMRTMHTHPFSWLYGFDVEETRSTLQSIIFHYLVADRALPLLGADMIQAVSLGFGRFVDGDMKEIACDEPIALAGVAAWMTRAPPAEERIRERTGLGTISLPSNDPPPTAKAFAACLAFYFSRAFDSKRKLSDIFKFPAPVPAWAKKPATLVELHTEAAKVRYSVIPGDDTIVAPLATSATSLEEVLSWMEHAHRTPFCIPQAEGSTFDLLFVLKLANGTYIWVIMRVDPTASDGGDLFRSLDEMSLLCDAENNVDSALRTRAVELLNTSPIQTSTSTSTAPTVLRAVAAFNDQIILERRAGDGSPPQASLSMDTFHELTATMPLSGFAQTVVANLLKRKPEAEAVAGEKGEERGRKRRNSMAIDEEAEIDKKRVRKKAKVTKKGKSAAPRPTTPPATASPYDLRARSPKALPADEKRKRGKAREKSPVPSTSSHNLRQRPPKKPLPAEETRKKRGAKSRSSS